MSNEQKITDTEIRWRQRLENLNKSFKHFESACNRERYDELELAGLVKSYELTFELCCKTLKDYLYEEGIDVKSPRETIKKAYQTALLENIDLWLAALDRRNQFSHIYNEKAANETVPYIKETLYPMIRAGIKILNEKVHET
ncbi:MAG: nucleotidyltransferase substrate binding protein [Planctomycetaceae bacterium]|jgi:nucleotidyltransferase substrate binding protein (TIGR01987 family)|nr:nucleotidyltransferase substrate binding protein [Planctomycetaceae bacterium]